MSGAVRRRYLPRFKRRRYRGMLLQRLLLLLLLLLSQGVGLDSSGGAFDSGVGDFGIGIIISTGTKSVRYLALERDGERGRGRKQDRVWGRGEKGVGKSRKG